MTSVAQVYKEICRMLLESPGLSLVYSENDALADLGDAISEFLQETGIIRNYVDISVSAGSGEVAVPDETIKVLEAYWNHRYLYPTHGKMVDEGDPLWTLSDGQPEQWREDELSANGIELIPNPDSSGTLRVFGSVQPSSSQPSITGNISLVPDSFAVYLKYRVLAKIFSVDGEARDLQRAAYCKARMQEAVNIGKAIMGEDIDG